MGKISSYVIQYYFNFVNIFISYSYSNFSIKKFDFFFIRKHIGDS